MSFFFSCKYNKRFSEFAKKNHCPTLAFTRSHKLSMETGPEGIEENELQICKNADLTHIIKIYYYIKAVQKKINSANQKEMPDP